MQTKIISHKSHNVHKTMPEHTSTHEIRPRKMEDLHGYIKFCIDKTWDAADFMSCTLLLSGRLLLLALHIRCLYMNEDMYVH